MVYEYEEWLIIYSYVIATVENYCKLYKNLILKQIGNLTCWAPELKEDARFKRHVLTFGQISSAY